VASGLQEGFDRRLVVYMGDMIDDKIGRQKKLK
jgi:hypothetical protein